MDIRRKFQTLARAIRSTQISVAVPWSLPQYIIANGFHPLYKPFFMRIKRLGVKCFVLDEFKTQMTFYSQPGIYMDFLEQQKLIQRRDASTGPSHEVTEFLNHENLCLQQSFPGQIEFHHTCAFAIGPRPYIFHCESFLPVFFPLFKQGEGLKAVEGLDMDAIRNHYRNVFEDEKCLMIVSHISETLTQFEDFFESETINKKLKNIPIGLDDHHIDTLMNSRFRRSKDRTTFLFTSSAHQNPASFRIRGGVLAIRLLHWFRVNRRPARFIFRCARPSQNDMDEFGLSHISLDSCHHIKIEWLVDYMTEEEMSNLFAVSHFFLLVSANLHSVSIMQAMAAGCIPIVTDTQGVLEYVDDQINGLVVAKIRERFWSFYEKSGILFDCHSNFISSEDFIFDRMKSIIYECIEDREKMRRLSVNAASKAKYRFRSAPYVKEFWQTAIRAISHIGTKSDSSPAALLRGCERELEVARDFGGPPIPIHINTTGSSKIYRLRNILWIFSNSRPEFLNCFKNITIFNGDVVELRRNGDLFFEEVE